MKYTAGEAATATGLNTATITRAIKKGRISATKSDTGAWQIDPAELHRVFPPLASKALQQGGVQGDARAVQEESKSTNNALQGELDTMRERLAAAEQRAAVAEALAEERARHCCAELAQQPIQAGDRRLAMTWSIGVASHPLHGGSAQALIAAADRALYQAKHQGRNRVAMMPAHA